MTQALPVKCINLLALTVEVWVIVPVLTDQNTPCPFDIDILEYVLCLAAGFAHPSLRQLKAAMKINI